MLPLFFLLWSILAVADRNVALIVDGNDSSLILKNELRKMADLSEEYYRSQGYEVIRLNASAGQGVDQLKKTLASQKNVRRLHLGIFSHGLTLASLEPEKKFEDLLIRPDELQTQHGLSTVNDKRHQFAYYFEVAGKKNDDDSLLGSRELRESIEELQSNNPDVETTLISNACFGGNAIRALQTLPRTQVFASSSSSQRSDVINLESGSVSYVEKLYEELSKGKNLLEASFEGQKSYLEKRLDLFHSERVEVAGLLSRPQSSVEVIFADACLSSAPSAEVCEERIEAKVLSAEVGKLMTQRYLSERIQRDDDYLDRTKKLFLCDRTDHEKLERIHRSALKSAYELGGEDWKVLTECYEKPLECKKVDLIEPSSTDEKMSVLKKCKSDVDCVLRNTEKDPFLRLLVLYDKNLSAGGPASSLCQKLEIAKAVNQKLKSCLSDDKLVNAPTLWEKLFSLYAQGLTK